MTGRENLEMTARLFGHGRIAARRAASAVIDQLSLDEVADRRSSTYSGGQRRRLDLGASLVGGPRLLLLDEPTTGLDPVSRREVWDAVRSLAAEGTDILLTTHYLDEANELADQVVVIDHGQVSPPARPASSRPASGRTSSSSRSPTRRRSAPPPRSSSASPVNAARLEPGGRHVITRARRASRARGSYRPPCETPRSPSMRLACGGQRSTKSS